jgi:glycosyltransferase involved in cell wall biosynthesis
MNPQTSIPQDLRRLDVVLSHDWLTGMRGGERVLELLCDAFPAARILTLIHNPRAVSDAINRHDIRTSWLQRVPRIERRYRWFLPLFPEAIERMRPPPAGLVISTSHCVAKSLIPPPGARHLCYCLTPMRYAWGFYEEYFGRNPAKRMLLAPVLAALRRWDQRTASRVDCFVAISRHVRQRIRACYGRDAEVVYPPVDTRKWTPADGGSEDFDLIVSALVPYKKIGLAIRAYGGLKRRLKIVGAGSELGRLRAMAGGNVEFLGRIPDDALLECYRRCRLLVFPGDEDFGLVPLEAQACGKPVVAYGRGGALETVNEGVTGTFFKEATAASLREGVEKTLSARWNAEAIRAHAERFDVPNFWNGFSRSIRKCLAGNA